MSKNQKKFFWTCFLCFCITATAAIYPQGAFDNLTFGGSIILLAFYLICSYFIHRYIKANADEVDKWFQK